MVRLHGLWCKPALSATPGLVTLNIKEEEDVVNHQQLCAHISMYASQIEIKCCWLWLNKHFFLCL